MVPGTIYSLKNCYLHHLNDLKIFYHFKTKTYITNKNQ